ncbi:hypothetical protein ERO13_A06G132402v2 [Gossypium hirsutum]|uniref:Uncharacterized protein n=4 Tax=Gossypium TaxID=3633 RepID=A0A5J5VDP1_GOSBA|nr:hypothetical protein ES319_A06G143200v1 [Gossypium barbadense]KAG4195806.1 hypothetical protein ERO13_A06G132402v2 [Gossypium hirsutum]TYH13716.1 hypothetical protein ES288_A06G161100v1 [Gossypium darwinii]TYI23313.1 hypothetical protein ES332_A06G156500v1 [Gossypium tomentosum]TYJ30645.1 hypothetical protein E1A91_A06G144400v1 [Gossypium mustelinum]
MFCLQKFQIPNAIGSTSYILYATDKVSWTLIVVGHGMPVFANEGIATTLNDIRNAAWSLMKDPSFHFYTAC